MKTAKTHKLIDSGFRRAYVDTSAYLASLLAEPHGKELRSLLKGFGLCTSSLLFLEAERNAVRLARENSISSPDLRKIIERLHEDVSLFAVKEPSLELCLNNQFPTITTPRSMDLIHLRTALWFRNSSGLELFVTLDKQQQAAAHEMGFNVWHS